ncbi:hypothetical protein FCULG_00005429 [Fusarium culmorum]|uniref:Uncharacterized protein n=1 Tax=Fusarium culmorum TaxID=5516 RepID=A0A2T4GXM0_FUSCU|nr:hypothetical protein FCULG_00005429 [Fusarium culmorum]
MGNFPTSHENPGTALTFTAHLNELRQLPAWKSDKSKQLLDRFQRGWTAIQIDRAAALHLVDCVAYHVEQHLKDVTSISTAGLTDGSVYSKAMKDNPDRCQPRPGWEDHTSSSRDLVVTSGSATTSDQANSASDSRYNLISLNWKIGLLELERKVEVVCRFLPTAAPTNGYFGFPSMDKTLAMMLHKDLLHGERFYNTMVRSTSATGVDSESNEGPGFGKTTAAAVVVLAMNASMGKVLASGP